ncbi:MAG: 2-oxo-4-hydroxy-4-carboxy-5-ureidoimidazoline decarboxylase [Candidatus Limnocylindria bacterium]
MIEREELIRALERAPALAEQLAREAPFPSVDAAIERARAVLDDMTVGERIAVLDAHPRIGADPGALSEASQREQGAEDTAVAAELARLNEEYERRFGFRFVVFVAGRSRAEIVPVLRDRLTRSREDELLTGTGELLAIARDRLGRS